MALAVTDIADLIIASQKYYDPNKFTDLTTDLQKFPAFEKLMKSSETQNGTQISVNLLTVAASTSIWRSMDSVDDYAIVDGLKTGQMDWRHANWNWSIDEREQAVNSGSATKILDLLKVRRHQAWMGAAAAFEAAFWSKPTDSTDVTTYWGLRNYIVSNATEGFNGGNASGFTTGNIFNSSTITRWKNFTNQYTSISTSDAVRKIRRAQRLTYFEPPVDASEARKIGFKCEIHTNIDGVTETEELVKLQNDNLGTDLGKYDDMVMIGKCPVKYCPTLDSDTTDPFLGINWDALGYVFLDGRKADEKKPRIHPLDHLKVVVDVDNSGNLICRNRRALFTVNKA